MRPVALLLCILILVCAPPLLAQSDIVIDDSSGWTVGKIRSDGRIEDASGRTMGRVRDDGRIEDASGWTIGGMRDDGRIEDSSSSPIGRVRDNGVVEDASGWTIGRIGPGTIDDSSGLTALRYSGDPDYMRLGAYLFFFNRVLRK